MCGRLRVISTSAEFKVLFNILAGPALNFPSRWNGAPTQDFPVVRRHPDTGARSLDLLRWGLVPSWAKDGKIAFTTINAKAETLATKPAFSKAWKASRRAIVPADGFYEWKKLADKKKQPYFISRADGMPMALAALWESCRLAGGEILRSFTIITTAANGLLAPLHDRMPVILALEDLPLWLGEVPASEAEIAALLRPCPPEWLTMVPVDPRMSNARNDGPEFCQPLVVKTTDGESASFAVTPGPEVP